MGYEYVEGIVSDIVDAINNVNDVYDAEIQWRYSRYALKKWVEESLDAKENLIDVFRKHPNWDERHLKVVLTQSYVSRDIDADYMFELAIELTNRGWLSGIDIDDSRIIEQFVSNPSQFVGEDDALEDVNRILNEWANTSKTYCAVGQKRSRAVGKILKVLGINEEAEYSSWFSRYGDAINPLEITKKTVISFHPADFLTSSVSKTWASCLNIAKTCRGGYDGYGGCYCSGGQSYSLDETTAIMYTVDNDYDGDEYHLQSKDSRAFAYIFPNATAFIMMCVYPDKTKAEFDAFRAIMERVIADSTGMPNLWKTISGHSEVRNLMQTRIGATHYPDYDHITGCNGKENHKMLCYQVDAGVPDSSEYVEIGHSPICIECGNYFDNSEMISCCQGTMECANCGDDIDSDEELYSNFHNQYGCEHCMSWNSYVEDYFFDDDETVSVWVNGWWRDIPLQWLEERGYEEGFFECEDCGEWMHEDYMHVYDEDGFSMCLCEDCYNDRKANEEEE